MADSAFSPTGRRRRRQGGRRHQYLVRYDDQEDALVRRRAAELGLSVPAFLSILSLRCELTTCRAGDPARPCGARSTCLTCLLTD
ncbi:hypothetical protein [Amycolatopsis aidingensis]|uniref:hypothetical protein n=1 Tax=Amycolatopsis aidingensis TaxID=2842453 RepID=UPI001C0BF2D6|nr:hypothetical protein [Amycolatopsis aidingensis]